MIDTHAHVDHRAFDEDRAEVVNRAWEAGLTAIIIPAITPPDFHRVDEACALSDRIYHASGIHPHHAGEVTHADLDTVERRLADPRCVAVGEIGLDYHYDFCPPDTQKWYFREQIRIAKRAGKPVIVHNRESDDDVLRILDEEQDGTLQGVLHCFSGDANVLERAMAIGLHVSFTGNITFKKSTLDEVVRAVPSNRYMIETDSPYITPVPHRGKRNEPAHVSLVAHKISELRSMTLQEVLDATTTTARRLFGITALLACACIVAVAQPTPPNEDDYEYEPDYEYALRNYTADSVQWEKWIKPRSFGFGPTVGSNTVVETWTYKQWYRDGAISVPTGEASQVNSFDGLIAPGGTLIYGVSDHLTIEATATFSQNTKPQEDFGLEPVDYFVAEVAGNFALNPYNKIHFLVSGGATYAYQSDGTDANTFTRYGVNVGPGIGINIPTSIGLFYPMVLVRFNFMFGTDPDRIVRKYFDEDGNQIFVNNVPAQDIADVTTLYSIPRLTLVYYPAF
jgi:TatD DNase family protein